MALGGDKRENCDTKEKQNILTIPRSSYRTHSEPYSHSQSSDSPHSYEVSSHALINSTRPSHKMIQKGEARIQEGQKSQEEVHGGAPECWAATDDHHN